MMARFGLGWLIGIAVFASLSGRVRAQTAADPGASGDVSSPLEATKPPPEFKPPELIKEVQAKYPTAAFDAGLVGTVGLEFDVSEAGTVENVIVKIPAGHGFDEAAVEAVKQFAFRPGRYDGKPVSAHVTYSYRFVIRTAPKVVDSDKQNDGAIEGGVFLRGSRAPLEGGKVLALDKSIAATGKVAQYEAQIDEKGHFVLSNLPPGYYQIIVAAPKARRFEVKETVHAKQVLSVKYYVEPNQYSRYEATIRGDLNREEISRKVISTEELVKMPGTLGDALRAVENLPGVARAPFNTGLIIIRGGKPTDSRAFMAGAEVPQLYHFGGLTSVVPTDLIEKIEYLPGNFGVRYGRAIAGIIDLDLREGKRDRFHGVGETNAFHTGLMVEGPLKKGSFILAARRSYIDGVMAAVLPSSGGVSFTQLPVYWDYQALLDYPVLGGKLRVYVFGSDDQLKLNFTRPADGDPALTDFGTHIFFHKFQLRYTKTLGSWQIYAQTSTGYQGTDGRLGRNLSYDIGYLGSDLRIEGRYVYSKKLKVLIGTDMQYAFAQLDLQVPPPQREGQIPSPISASERQRIKESLNLFNIGVYAEAQYKPSERLLLSAGLRADYFRSINRFSFNPRFTARVQLWKYTTLKSGVGVFAQDPQPQDYVAGIGNPRLRPETAIHTQLGFEQGLLPGLMLEVTGFYKHLYDLVAESGNFVTIDGKTEAERVASDGKGRVYGGEFMLRQLVSKWFFGWASYTVMRSERSDCPTCSYRLFDFDQTHIFVIALHAYLPRGWEIGTRFRYISGRPYTPSYGGFYDADSDVYAPARGPVNTGRLGEFHQLDIRIDKAFLFKYWTLKIYLDITNVYNRQSPESVQPSYDFTRQGVITGLPIIPSFGIRGEW